MKSGFNNFQLFVNRYLLVFVVLTFGITLLFREPSSSVLSIMPSLIASFVSALWISFIYKQRWNAPYRPNGRWRDATIMGTIAFAVMLGFSVFAQAMAPEAEFAVPSLRLEPPFLMQKLMIFALNILIIRIGIGMSQYLVDREVAPK